MTFWNSIKVAFVALRLNALRSFLTMLGIIIGIASVIVMVAISSGAQKEVDKMIGNLGTNMLIINPGAGRWGGRRSESGTDEPFSEKDLKSITEEFDFIVRNLHKVIKYPDRVYKNRISTASRI